MHFTHVSTRYPVPVILTVDKFRSRKVVVESYDNAVNNLREALSAYITRNRHCGFEIMDSVRIRMPLFCAGGMSI